MKEPRKDDERLSALLEGRLSGPEREALLAHLAASDEDYEVFADAAEYLSEIEQEDARAAAAAAATAAAANEPVVTPVSPAEGAETTPASADVIPLRQRARRGWNSLWVRMAAAVTGVLLASGVVWRAQSLTMASPLQIAAAVDTLPPRWTDTTVWPADRGGNRPDAKSVRAAQAGARLVHLAIAVRAGDSARTELAASKLLEFQPGADDDAPLLRIQALAGGPSEELQPLVESAADELEDELDAEDYLRLGAWAEAGRLAARSRDTTFFSSRTSKTMLRRADGLTGDNPGAQTALATVRRLLRAESLDYASLERTLGEFLAAIAG